MDRSEFDIDAELEKYDYAAAVRDIGFEPHPTMAGSINDTFDMPVQNVDDFFVKLGNQTKTIADETARTSVAAPRQIAQEAIDFGVDWFGEQMKDFYTVNGFASDDQVKAILPQSMTQYAKDKGVPLELPLKSFQPETGIGTTARELLAYIGGFLLTKGKGTARQAGDTVIDDMGRHAGTLLQGVRGNTGGAMSLNAKEANLSELAVELGFADELRVYFDEQSMADRAAEGIADQIAMRANAPLDADYELTAEQRLNRKVDTVVEENALGGILATAIMSTAKLLKTAALAPKTSAGLTAGATVTASDDAEGMPVSRLARTMRQEQRAGEKVPMTEDLRTFREGQEVEVEDTTPVRAVDEDELGFYSQAFRAAEGLGMDKMTSQQAKRMMSKAGVKPDEMTWTGLNDLFAENDTVTKDQLIKHLDENRVQLQEIQLETVDSNVIDNAVAEYDQVITTFRDDLSEYRTIDSRDYYDHRIEDYSDELSRLTDPDEYLFRNIVSELKTGNFGNRYPEEFEAEWSDNLFRAIEEHGDDFAEVLKKNNPEQFQYIGSDVEEAIENIAREEYLNEPVIEMSARIADDSGGSVTYTIEGNDDPYGYTIFRDGEVVVDGGEIYSLNEALVRAEQEAMERGDFDFAGNFDDMTDPDGRPAGYTRWEEYKEDGGKNYKEMLLVNDNYKGDPDKAKSNKTDLGAFRESHYPEENIIYHVRTTDREAADGGKVLYIEELQSDWAQRGRSRGFFNPDARDPDAVKADIVDIEKQKANLAPGLQREIRNERQRPNLNDITAITEYDMANMSPEYKKLMAEEKRLNKELNVGRSLPRGPFVGTTDKWSSLAMKRLLRYASENNYDYIAITPGQVQADRWNNEGLKVFYDDVLIKNINSIIGKIDAQPGQMSLFPGVKDYQVGKIDIDGLDDGPRNVIKLTPQIKEASKKGSALFTPAPIAAGAGVAAAAKQEAQQPQM